MSAFCLAAALFLPLGGPTAFAGSQPHDGKVRIYVFVDSAGVYRGVQQRASELQDSARDLRKHLKKNKWIELTEKEEDADIRLRVLGRRNDPDKGNVLGYVLDAGAYRSEDEFAYVGESVQTGGGRSMNPQNFSDQTAPRRALGWGELAKRFARSLDGFAEANYDRIIEQRRASKH